MKYIVSLMLSILFIGQPSLIQASDRALTKEEIESTFVGNRYGYTGKGDKVSLHSDGQYELILYGGYFAKGTYIVEDDGKICITLPTIAYCEQIFIEPDGKFFLVDRNSDRKPIEILR